MPLLLRFKVSGHSMEPTIKNNQEILVSSLPLLFFKPKVGDMIAFNDLDKWIVKRIKEVNGEKFLVEGDNKKDSKEFGWIEKEKIIGKVIYIISG